MSSVDFVEACDEPRHKTVLQNDYVRVLKVRFPAKDRTLYHRHQLDSFYIDLADAHLLNEMVGQGESEVHARYGGVSYKPHSQAPYIHRITCLEDEKDWFCLDGELLNAPPALAGPRSPLAAPAHVLVLESPRVRIYKARVHSKPRDGDAPGAATYPFHGVLVALAPGVLAPPYGACAPGDVWEIEPGAPLPRAALADPGTDGDRDEDAALDAYVVELRA